jgi:hypothetical protein
MDIEARLSEIEDGLRTIFTRLENIEHVLEIRPSSSQPLHSDMMESILGRLADLESRVEIE